MPVPMDCLTREHTKIWTLSIQMSSKNLARRNRRPLLCHENSAQCNPQENLKTERTCGTSVSIENACLEETDWIYSLIM